MANAEQTRLNLGNVSEHLVAELPWLDDVAKRMHAAWDPLLGPDGPADIKDALYGTWLGPPLHPAIVTMPIGFWTSSAALDIAGMQRGADITLKLGTLSALAVAVTGYAQWHDLQNLKTPRRLGTLHAMLNIAATGLYGASWLLRNKGERGTAVALSSAGLGMVMFSGLLGGDLAYKLGIGVSRVAFNEPATEWTAVIGVDELPSGTLTRVEHGEDPLVLLKEGDMVYAASATCTHVGAPLDEGERSGTCVTCPWHGSQFDLKDGQVVHGPATSPLHGYETRVTDGQVEVRRLLPA
jgi:nitrite reductase/ring-hydroxylating ferredoxin subunit/uncharacterized membrane protein